MNVTNQIENYLRTSSLRPIIVSFLHIQPRRNKQAEQSPPMSRIREVWAPNLQVEMRNIREAIEKYPYVAMVYIYSPGVYYPSAHQRARILNFLALLPDLLDRSKPLQIITIRRCAAMLTF